MEIITVTNNKGGTGKTTTVQCLAVELALRGKKVLIVDSDPQENLSLVFKVLNVENNLYKLFTGECNINECRYRVNMDGAVVDVIPSSKKLVNADNEFTREPYLSAGCQELLKSNLDLVKDQYDYIFIDTPPAMGILTLNALVSSMSAIVPMQAEVFSIQGLDTLKEKIDMINKRLNPTLHIKGILLTRHNERIVINRDLRNSIVEEFHTKVFNTFIRESVAVRESHANKTCVILQNPENNVSLDYKELVKEIFEGGANL